MSEIDEGLPLASSTETKDQSTIDPPQSNGKTEDRVAEPPTAPALHETELPKKDDSSTVSVDNASDPAKDDSEAETVLSSPVKRREALRKINGIKTEAGSTSLSTELKHDDATTSPTSSKKSGDTLNGRKNGDKHGIAGSNRSASDIDASFEEDDDDNHSNISSRKSRTGASRGSRTVSRSPEELPNSKPGPPNGHGNNNTKKRKHRESSAGHRQSNTDSAKRQRRASFAGRKSSDRSSEELSPPPRLRRHKRTSSGQTKEEPLEDEATQQSRSRRAASHLALQNQKVFKSTWDSGSESEVSTKQVQGRSTRGVGNRSVSTPGRPGGRDHKRHVNKYGFTRLAEACEAGDLDMVKEWRSKDPEQLEQREFAGNTPLQVASLNGNVEIVQYLLDEGCNPHCANSDKDTPLIDAVENEHPEVVKLLLQAGVDPLRQNMKGQQALDLVPEGTDSAPEMRTMLRAAIEDWKAKGAQRQQDLEDRATSRPGPKQALHFMARTPDNLMKLVLDNDRTGVTEFLNARVAVDNLIVAAAAKTGDVYLVNMLLAEMTPRKAKSKPEKPMMAVLGSSHFEMVKTLTDLDQFDPLYQEKQTNKTWVELAEDRNGPHVDKEKELFLGKYHEAQARRGLSSSPISRRTENGTKRYDSPDLSDAEMEDADSPDAAKTKRRLMSKKDMRAASSRKSPSTESSRAASSPEAVMKPAEAEDFKQPQRKSRTLSISSQPADNKMKKIKAARREEIAMFNTGGPTKKRKSDHGKGSEKIVDNAGSNKKLSVVKQEEERAEALRREAEEAAKKAEEDRLEQQRKEAQRRQETQERLEQRATKLQAFPSAIRRVLDLDASSPSEISNLLCQRFLPLQAVSGMHLDFRGEEPNSLWVLSYQAALILRGAAANDLLGLPIDPENPSHLPEIKRYAVAAEQRPAMISALEPNNFCGDSPDKLGPSTVDMQAAIVEWRDSRPRVYAECEKFLTMDPLSWINVQDLFAAKVDLQTNHADKYPHLQLLPPLEVYLDSLNDSPFNKPPAQGTPMVSTPDNALNDEFRQRYGHGLKEADGRVNGVLMTAWQKTRVEVVRD